MACCRFRACALPDRDLPTGISALPCLDDIRGTVTRNGHGPDRLSLVGLNGAVADQLRSKAVEMLLDAWPPVADILPGPRMVLSGCQSEPKVSG